jgi:hypothetical protein
MGSWFVSALFKAFLEWLASLWVRFIQKQKHIEQGREEVREEIRKETEKIKHEWETIDRTDLSIDDALSRLRDRASRGDVSRPGSTNTTGS